MSPGEVMDDYRLPDNEILALKPSDKVILHKTLKVKREADNVKAVYLLGSGHPVKLTAEVLDINEQTVRQYFLDDTKQDKRNRKKRQWVQLHYSGKTSFLTNEQEQELIQHLDENLYQRSQDIISHIKKRYKVHYSSSGVKKLLHRLDFSYKKPKIVPGKFDNHLQDLFLRKYRRILKTKGEKYDGLVCRSLCRPMKICIETRITPKGFDAINVRFAANPFRSKVTLIEFKFTEFLIAFPQRQLKNLLTDFVKITIHRVAVHTNYTLVT